MTSCQENDDKKAGKVAENILVGIAISFALGTALARFSSWDIAISWSAAILAASAVFVFFLLEKQRALLPGLSTYLLLPLFFLAGQIHAGPFFKPPSDPLHIYQHVTDEQQTATITGILAESPTRTYSVQDQRTRLLIGVDSLITPNSESLSPGSTTRPVTGLVQISLKGPPPADLSPGDRFMARTELARTYSFATPGVFNYREFLADQGIWVSGRTRDPINIIKLHDLAEFYPEFSSLTPAARYRYLPERIRQKIAEFLDSTLDRETSGLYRAILTGDKAGVPPSIIEDFKAAGCIHILAISGMHMGLLAMLSTITINWLLTRSTRVILTIPVFKTAALLTLLPLTCYALIAGFNIPVVRSLIMAAVFIAAVLFDRQKSLASNIALAGLLILIWRPTSLFTASFQLSFTAVVAIAVIYGKIRDLIFPSQSDPPGTRNTFLAVLKRWILAGALISAAAIVGTAPLLIYHFNRLSIFSPLTNLIVEPLVCFWSLIIGLFACIALPVSPGLAGILFQAGGWGLKAAARICALFAPLPGSSLIFATPSLIEICAYFTLLIVLCRKNQRLRPILVLLLILFLAGYPVIKKIEQRFSTDTTITFLDVGQGSATLAEFPGGKTVLMDGGGPDTERFNTGRDIIAPFLWKKHLTRLDSVIISHPHADHYNGLFFILKHFRPKTLWLNGQPSREPDFQKLLALARKMAVDIRIPPTGGLLLQAGTSGIRCVANPFQDLGDRENRHPADEYGDRNVNSLVLRIYSEDKSFLLPGDIDRNMEKNLIAEGVELQADVLLSAHHGSNTSNSLEFLKAVSPRDLIISTGRNNPFNYPAPETIERCRQAGIRALSTAWDGTISYTISKEGRIKLRLYNNRKP